MTDDQESKNAIFCAGPYHLAAELALPDVFWPPRRLPPTSCRCSRPALALFEPLRHPRPRYCNGSVEDAHRRRLKIEEVAGRGCCRTDQCLQGARRVAPPTLAGPPLPALLRGYVSVCDLRCSSNLTRSPPRSFSPLYHLLLLCSFASS